MKYVFVNPQFVAGLYFCEYMGQGFRLSNRVEDALVATDPDTAVKLAHFLKLQSGFPVAVKELSWPVLQTAG